jgi:hypothetical protein
VLDVAAADEDDADVAHGTREDDRCTDRRVLVITPENAFSAVADRAIRDSAQERTFIVCMPACERCNLMGVCVFVGQRKSCFQCNLEDKGLCSLITSQFCMCITAFVPQKDF